MAVESENIMTGALRPDIELIRGDSLLLFDRQREIYFRVDEQTLEIIAHLTESMPVGQFMERLRKNGISADLQRVTESLFFLKQNDLMIPLPGEMSKKKQLQSAWIEKNWLLRFSSAYLFFRLPPWRPEHFFDRIAPYVSWLASRNLVTFYVVIALIGYFLLFRNLQSVVTEFRNSLSWIGLVKYFIVIIFVKCIHEAAHSLAAVHFHCRVRGIGIGFMVFCPRFYTDTTDSWRLPRSQRILIDSAGIIAELLLSGIAAILWTYLPPGWVHSTMFYILAVSTLSTLAINGNPFIRYDGYYILCDITGADNLMSRSAAAVRQYWHWYLLRIGNVPDFSATWKYACFGVVSFGYRIFLYTSIILVIYHKFNKVIALAMIFLEIYGICLYPLWRELQQIYLLSKHSSGKTEYLLFGGVFTLLVLLAFIPIGWNENLPGEVSSRLRVIAAAPEDGFLTEDLKPREVKKDDILFQLLSPHLNFSLTRMRNKYQEERLHRIFQERDPAGFAEAKLSAAREQSIENAVRELERQKKGLTVKALENGFFIPASRNFGKCRFVPKNTILGHIYSTGKIVVAYADDQQLGLLTAGENAEFLVHGSLKKYHGVIRSVSPTPAVLDDTLLLQPFGGPIPVYYGPRDGSKYDTTQPLYRIEIESPDADTLIYGQVLKVCLKKQRSIAGSLLRMLVSVWHKEFSEIF